MKMSKLYRIYLKIVSLIYISFSKNFLIHGRIFHLTKKPRAAFNLVNVPSSRRVRNNYFNYDYTKEVGRTDDPTTSIFHLDFIRRE